MARRLIYTFGIILFIIILAGSIIAYGRGYRFDLRQKSLTTTGILSAISTPEGASIWIDGKLRSATNASLSIPPGWYQLQIGKEGYQPWEKKIRIQGEVVTRTDALLIPTNPSLKALTSSGILKPVLSTNGTKVAYIVPDEEATFSSSLKSKKGIWALDLRYGPLGGKSEPKQIFTQSGKTDWASATLIFSPDEKQILIKFSKKQGKTETVSFAYLISPDSNSPPLDVTDTWTKTADEWKTTTDTKNEEAIASLPPLVSGLLKNSASGIRFSPDETKILYLATSSASLSLVITPPIIGSNTTAEVRSVEPGKYYIYDTKEDKNFYITDQKTIKEPSSLLWYTDSKHIVMIEKDTIYIIDYDGTNKRVVYSGPFENNIVYPWTSPGRLVILTNFNKPKNLHDLYEIDLR
ncbi:PEGA domain-containing protein [Candidatus Gottesmanbacteria bacterium]|nr:PEGA domain-containing protein [Candidatus Gottesmanbacteria bacterium]